jgi:thiol-disulfide isomerase/thioredoxin
LMIPQNFHQPGHNWEIFLMNIKKCNLSLMAIFMAIIVTTSTAGYASGHDEKPAVKSEHGEEAAPTPIGPNRHYNPGPVEMFPKEISGIDILSRENFTYKTKRGRATMVFFVASWCESCQQLMPQIKIVANKFARSYTDVIYVFAHDTKADAAGFAKEHKLAGRLLLANHEILKAFKNPTLPSVYIGDRYNYIANRYIKFTTTDLESLNEYMTKLTLL